MSARAPLDAVLFDMDGVVTDTARGHAAAWKRLFDDFFEARAARLGVDPSGSLRPFDVAEDYRAHLDGRPRHDGIRALLGARSIAIPEGSPSDTARVDSVHGLAARKQALFERWLDEHEVEPSPGAVHLLGRLRARRIPAALFTSSRNAARVLRAAGVAPLFDAVVDGSALDELGLPGKPAPAALLEAARRVRARPARAAVLEDSLAGVEAGARGGFGLVVGVARGEDPGARGAALARAGAHLVVGDPAELALSPDGSLVRKTLLTLPRASEASLRALLGGREIAVFVDFDGTLAPIVDDPAEAEMSASTRRALQALALRRPIAIVSGRDLARLRELGLGSAYLAGSHGFSIEGPGGAADRLEVGASSMQALDDAERELGERLASTEGLTIERKRLAIAVHLRRVDPDEVPRADATTRDVVRRHPGLELGRGKDVLRVQPDEPWDKGRAVLFVLGRMRAKGPPSLYPVYVGDDLTDEDAFRAISGRGLGVVVRDGEADRSTAADLQVGGVEEVRRLLEQLARVADGGGHDD